MEDIGYDERHVDDGLEAEPLPRTAVVAVAEGMIAICRAGGVPGRAAARFWSPGCTSSSPTCPPERFPLLSALAGEMTTGSGDEA